MTEKRGVSMPDDLFSYIQSTKAEDQTVSGRIRELIDLGRAGEDELAHANWLHPEHDENVERVREAVGEWCERRE